MFINKNFRLFVSLGSASFLSRIFPQTHLSGPHLSLAASFPLPHLSEAEKMSRIFPPAHLSGSQLSGPHLSGNPFFFFCFLFIVCQYNLNYREKVALTLNKDLPWFYIRWSCLRYFMQLGPWQWPRGSMSDLTSAWQPCQECQWSLSKDLEVLSYRRSTGHNNLFCQQKHPTACIRKVHIHIWPWILKKWFSPNTFCISAHRCLDWTNQGTYNVLGTKTEQCIFFPLVVQRKDRYILRFVLCRLTSC